MKNNNETVRVNVVMRKDVQAYYKSVAKSYNLPYTNYITMVLTQIYENDNEYNEKNNQN